MKKDSSKQLRQAKIKNEIIKFKNIFDVTYICGIHNLKDFLEKGHHRNVMRKPLFLPALEPQI